MSTLSEYWVQDYYDLQTALEATGDITVSSGIRETTPTVSGVSSSYTPEEVIGSITNYDSDSFYAVSSSGTSTISGSSVVWQLPEVAGNYTANIYSVKTDYILSDPGQWQIQVSSLYSWNPDNENVDVGVELSNDNLDVLALSNGWRSIECLKSRSSGKWYWELEQMATNIQTWWGAGDVDNPDWDQHPGKDANSVGFYLDTPRSYHGGSFKSWGASGFDGSEGAIMMFAIDLDAGSIWYGIDGKWLNSSGEDASDPAGTCPAAETETCLSTGNIAPMVGPYGDEGKVGARFLASALTYTPPSGFSAWGS